MVMYLYRDPGADVEYTITERSQRTLTYLYGYGPAKPSELLENAHQIDPNETPVKDVLPPEGLEFVRDVKTGQKTLEGERVTELDLTADGKAFVNENKFRLRVPFTIHEYLKRMERIQDEFHSNFDELVALIEADRDETEELRLERLY